MKNEGKNWDKVGTSDNDGAGARLWQLWGGCGLLVKEGLWTCQQPGSAPCIALQTNSAKPSVGDLCLTFCGISVQTSCCALNAGSMHS